MDVTRSVEAGSGKRDALLAGALRSIARTGLHNTPMSAIAREAGVAVGTAYLYFDGKAALINALYLEVEEERTRSAELALDADTPAREQVWDAWSRFARWHLEHRDAANFILQCEASGILSEEARARQLEIRAGALDGFTEAVRRAVLLDLPAEVFYALWAGPILVLAHMQDKQEIEITEQVLRLAFEGVARSVLRADAAAPPGASAPVASWRSAPGG